MTMLKSIATNSNGYRADFVIITNNKELPQSTYLGWVYLKDEIGTNGQYYDLYRSPTMHYAIRKDESWLDGKLTFHDVTQCITNGDVTPNGKTWASLQNMNVAEVYQHTDHLYTLYNSGKKTFNIKNSEYTQKYKSVVVREAGKTLYTRYQTKYVITGFNER